VVAATLQQVREELAARARAIDGLRCTAEVPAKPQPGMLSVRGPIRWTYDVSMDGDWSVTFAIDLFANPQDLQRAQQLLDAYLSPAGSKSVPHVLEDTVVTTGIIDSANVIGGNSPYAFYGDESTIRLLVATLEIQVYPHMD